MQQVDLWQLLRRRQGQRRQRVWRPATLLASFGVVGPNQHDQRMPWHQHLQLKERLLVFSLFLGSGQLEIRTAYHPLLQS